MRYEIGVNWLAELIGKLTKWEGPFGPNGPLATGFEGEIQRADPVPSPWRSAVPQLVQAAHAKALAARLHDAPKLAMQRSADAAIELILDDVCGTPPRRVPWPWPGPPPWVWEIASELTFLANNMQAGELRDSLFDISAKVAERGLGARQGKAAL